MYAEICQKTHLFVHEQKWTANVKMISDHKTAYYYCQRHYREGNTTKF